jgi:hypothetical protein
VNTREAQNNKHDVKYGLTADMDEFRYRLRTRREIEETTPALLLGFLKAEEPVKRIAPEHIALPFAFFYYFV